jgi:ankyrin repeat protein
MAHLVRTILASFFMAVSCLVASSPARAFDMGPVLDRLAMARLAIAADETPLAIGGTDATRPYVAVGLGRSTFFLDRYGPDNQRLSRSVPLPAPRCMSGPMSSSNDPWMMSVRELAPGVIITTNPCPGGDTIFFQDRDGNLVSFMRPVQSTRDGPLDLTVWTRTTDNSILPNIRLLLAQLPDPATGRPYGNFAVRVVPAPMRDLDRFTALVNRPTSAISNPTTHLEAVRAGVMGMDWRTALDTRTLNNAGFYLSSSTDCRDLETAIAMLKHVTNASPNRHVTNLNLADAYAKASSLTCNNLPASLGASQEAFRLYCTGIGLAQVPARVLARHRSALVTPKTSTGSACQPQMAMQRAILNNDMAALERALTDPENDVDVTFPDGKRALGLALERKQGVMARLLLAAGADPDRSSFYPQSDRAGEFTPLVRAIWNYDVETVAALVGKSRSSLDFTLNGSPYRPLFKALELRPQNDQQETDKRTIIDLILRLEPSPSQYDNDGKNAFYAAADGYSSRAVFETVAKFGAFINHPTRYGQTPLFAIGPFASQNAVATQAILLDMGANPNQQNQTGATPLIHAFAWTNADTATVAAMVKGLLESGADPNIADQDGRTALGLAAMRAMPDTVDLLVARGARLPPTPRYQTDPVTWIENRIAQLEADPTTRNACACLADYQRIRLTLRSVAPPTQPAR